MPELPEVERVRLSLLPHLLGQQVLAVTVQRASVIVGQSDPAALLVGQRIDQLVRHGKQLAIVARADEHEPGRCVHVHLGMSGSLRCLTAEQWQQTSPAFGKHVHVWWQIEPDGVMVFHDPRRFGGVWTFASLTDLEQTRWQSLGPDALLIRPRELYQGLCATRRPLKAALLDQTVVAGLGNIYVDELLYACRVAPHRQACELTMPQVQTMVRQMRSLLQRAIQAGGSTLRNYVDVNGASGRYQNRHQVYGRGGQACRRCRQTLNVIQVAGRTTVYCPACQSA